MLLTPGTRLGPYEVLGPLGAGGMGEVYRARDTKLSRDVALKVLPESFAADPDRLMRFEREAKTLASLNHPNIAAIYGIEGADGTRALVMELVEGEDLSERTARGAIPVADAIAIARQIADALEAAHEQGIIHRDLKPANVKVREDGTVKVLDFGLAKALDAGTSEPTNPRTSEPTMTSPAMTQMGMILGTAAYMAPEQARGKTVDRRADVWAFGVVLYEMLAGRRLFARDEVSDTLAAVLTAEPDMALLPPATPAAVRRLLARCLAKDRRQRLDSMGAARLDLEEARSPQSAEATPRAAAPLRGVLGTFLLVAAGIALGALAVAVWPRASGSPADATASLLAQVPAPPDTLLAFFDGFDLSPDGTTLAFAARTSAGLRQIWIRSFDSATAAPIAGTDNGAYPFWSPDGRSIAFFADYKLKRVNLDGSGLQTICDVPAVMFITGTWGTSGDILWATNYAAAVAGQRQRVFRVPASGGTPVVLDELGAAVRPFWLPDGRHFLYARAGDDAGGIWVADTGGSESRLVLAMNGRGGAAQYAYGGGVVFANQNDALVAQRIDEASGEAVGAPVPIALDAGSPKGWLAVASDGRRVVAIVRSSPGSPDNPGAPVGRLAWVDRQGRTTGTLGDAATYWTLRLAPDGNTAVVNLNNDLWMLGNDGRRVRFTDSGLNFNPVWSPSGQEVIFSQGERGPSRPVRRGLAPGAPTLALPGAIGGPSDWSRDGRLLTSDGDIHVYNLADGTSTPWLATRAQEWRARFSPDGRWVAFASNATGRFEVYVRAFDGAGQPIPVSTDGGDHPIWRQDGRELFFLSPGNDLMSASVTMSGDQISLGQPEKLFSIPLNDATREVYSPYDVAPDGQRFLMNLPDRPTPLFLLDGLDAIMGKR